LSDQAKRVYWAFLVVLGLVLGYEALTRQVYGDNSTWIAVVFFGIAVLSLGRLVAVGRGLRPKGRETRIQRPFRMHADAIHYCLRAWM